MIVDEMIDEASARYFCAVDGKALRAAAKKAKAAAKQSTPER